VEIPSKNDPSPSLPKIPQTFICRDSTAVIPVGFKPTTFRTGIYAVETRRKPLPVGVSLFFIFSFDGNLADVSVFFFI